MSRATEKITVPTKPITALVRIKGPGPSRSHPDPERPRCDAVVEDLFFGRVASRWSF